METGTEQKWFIPIMPLCINGKPGFIGQEKRKEVEN